MVSGLLSPVSSLLVGAEDGGALSGTLLYSRLTDGTWQIWQTDLAMGQAMQVTSSVGDKRYPSWGPDGRVAYQTSNAEAYVEPRSDEAADTTTVLESGGGHVESHLGVASGHGVPPQAGRARNAVERTAARWAAGAMPRTECESGPAAAGSRQGPGPWLLEQKSGM